MSCPDHDGDEWQSDCPACVQVMAAQYEDARRTWVPGYQTIVDRVGMDDPGRLYNALKGREDVRA